MRVTALASHSQDNSLDLRGLLSRCPDVSNISQRERDHIASLYLPLFPDTQPQATASPPQLSFNFPQTTHLALEDTDITCDALRLLPHILPDLSKCPHRLQTVHVTPNDTPGPTLPLKRKQRSRLWGAFLRALPCAHLRHVTLDLPAPLQPHLTSADTWAPALSCMRALTLLRMSVSSSAPTPTAAVTSTAKQEALLSACISPPALPELRSLSIFMTHATHLSVFLRHVTQLTGLTSLELRSAAIRGRATGRPVPTVPFTRGPRSFVIRFGILPLPTPLPAVVLAALPALSHISFRSECDDSGGRLEWLPLPLVLPEGSLGALEECAASVTSCALRLRHVSDERSSNMHEAHACRTPASGGLPRQAGNEVCAAGAGVAPGAQAHRGGSAAAAPMRPEMTEVAAALTGEQLPLLRGLPALRHVEVCCVNGGADEHAADAVAPALPAATTQSGGLGSMWRSAASRGAGSGSDGRVQEVGGSRWWARDGLRWHEGSGGGGAGSGEDAGAGVMPRSACDEVDSGTHSCMPACMCAGLCVHSCVGASWVGTSASAAARIGPQSAGRSAVLCFASGLRT